MKNRDRDDLDAVVNERVFDLVQLELRFSSADLRFTPDVAERPAHRLRRFRIRVRVDRFPLTEVEGPNVVEPHEVVGV